MAFFFLHSSQLDASKANEKMKQDTTFLEGIINTHSVAHLLEGRLQ